MKHLYIFITLLFTSSQFVEAQHLNVNHLELLHDKVIIHYDLLDTIVGRSYTIRVYTSHDTFLNPLTQVSGDAGFEVSPGTNRKIVWDIRKEYGNAFKAEISIEVRARIFVPFINVQQINSYTVFKRKRAYNLTWSGGGSGNVLNFDLYRGDQKVLSFPNIANVGHHQFVFPVYLKAAKGYKFRISDTKNADEVVFSTPFQIKRKVPLLIKVLGAGVVSTSILFLAPDKTTDNTMPGAPIPD